MQAQRETWLSDPMITETEGIHYRYALGHPGHSFEPSDDCLHYGFPDGPIYERHSGGPRTWVLNHKVYALACYALENDYDFLFKCDDDTYARPRHLLMSGFEDHDYSGLTDRHYAADIGFYKWCQGGAGYWLSRDALKVVVRDGISCVKGAEDFAVGQTLARAHVEATHDERYIAEPSAEDLYRASERIPDWITLHKVGPKEMRALHASIRD
jgi:hypothetical protein